MTSSTEIKAESPGGCEGKTEYFELVRKLAVSGSSRFVSQMVEISNAYVLEIDAENLSHSGVYNLAVAIEFGNDGHNWARSGISPAISFTATGYKAGVLAAFSAKFARLVVLGSGAGSARISAGLRFRTEPPKFIPSRHAILPDLESVKPGEDTDYLLLADRLYVAQGSSVILAPVSMTDRNAVRLEIVVVQPTSLPISADLQGSNDTQTWETLAVYSGLGFGYNSPAALTGVSHRYVRVKVNGPQSFFNAIVELGMSLSRQSP